MFISMGDSRWELYQMFISMGDSTWELYQMFIMWELYQMFISMGDSMWEPYQMFISMGDSMWELYQMFISMGDSMWKLYQMLCIADVLKQFYLYNHFTTMCSVEKNHDLKKKIKKIGFLKFKSDLFDFFLNLVYRYLYRCLNL